MNIFDFLKKDRRVKCREFRRLYGRLVAQDVMMSLSYVGMWVKNSRFELLEISDQAASILYNRLSNQCVGLTDYCIAKEGGMNISEDQFANICRASDLYLTDAKPKYFVELISDTHGNEHIWKTIKSKVYIEDDYYYFGFATFLDVVLGSYEAANDYFHSDMDKLEKLNERLFVYK
jgi:hypothetical protein